MFRELMKEDDFFWYKTELDVARKYEHDHEGGLPDRYPCRVYSDFFDNPNGPYTYFHTFVYKVENICEGCGHSTMVWPEVIET